MEIRRQDSLGFNGDSFQDRRSRRDHHHHHLHQTLYSNHPDDQVNYIFKPNNDSTLLISDPSDSIPISSTTRSISRSPPPLPPPPAASSTNQVLYRECLKNHAASMGGLALDGCGEFMPVGEEGTPDALKCAACECHRNFHRKETDHGGDHRQQLPVFAERAETRTKSYPHHPLPLPNSSQRYPRGFSASVMMNFGDGSGAALAESSSEDLNNMHASNLQERGEKRFRTKFSQEQKEKMTEFAEKLGWKIQKQDEEQVHEFCSTVGIKRKIFKVWMHNNKSIRKKQM